jgi:hypothetical protein
MAEGKPSGPEKVEDIEIDYDHIDVEAIMDQVRKVAAANPLEQAASPPVDDPAPIPPAPTPAPVPPSIPPPPGLKAVLKDKLIRAMRPFAPVVRLLGLPLHEDIRAAVEQLDQTNRRLDALASEIPIRYAEAAELANIRERLNTRMIDLDRTMEYVKLLHHLDHNLVVELTKLRIEFETLRSKVLILEKDLDAGVRRERILEKQLLS